MIRIIVINELEQDRKTILSHLSLQKDFHVTRTGSTGCDAIRFASDQRSDIIIMNNWMPDISCTEIAPIIKRKSPVTGLLVLCSRAEAGWVNLALRAGISGILLKQTDMDKLAEAVRAVICGGYYLSKPVRNQVLELLSESTVKSISHSLTCSILAQSSPTCRQIMNYLAIGYTDKEIADNLKIAAGTVRNSIIDLKRKSGLKNRTHLVLHAYSCGLITIPPEGAVKKPPPLAETYPKGFLPEKENNGSGPSTLQ
ncbi:MAG TPA: hypothetical protein DEQ14_05325 [Treponema sp.]|nr:hypothetical protein [Treponema sp.]